MEKKIIGLVVTLIIGFALGFPSGYLMTPSIEPDQKQIGELQDQIIQKNNQIQVLQEKVNNMTIQIQMFQEQINNLTTQLEILLEEKGLPDFNIFGVVKLYSSPSFFELEGIAFDIQNMGEGTATNVTIGVVWSVKDISERWTDIDFGVTNDVSDALSYYNEMLETFGEDSVYTRDAYDRLQRAMNDNKELRPNQIKSYMLTVPEDVNNREEIPESPYYIVELGDITFTVSCAEGVKETFVFG